MPSLLKMIRIGLRLVWPYLLTPWRSPLLRWRMETYGVLDDQGRLLHADDITRTQFLRFTFTHRTALWRFLRWAARL
jgi:hypothetical protein